MPGRLGGKVAVITGAASGLGLATAHRFTAEGATVAVVDRSREAAHAAARAVGSGAIGVAADVGDRDAAAAMAAAVLERLGRVDAVFANAGVPGEGMAHDVDLDHWDRVLRVNLTGVLLSVRGFLPAMMAQRSGSLVLTASVGGLSGLPSMAPYTAAKAGVVGLAKQLAIDYAPYRIRANAICPATVPTPLVRAAYAERPEPIEATMKMRARTIPLGRLGEPDDVANLALFLASDESTWITGGVHVVDGGMTAALAPAAPTT